MKKLIKWIIAVIFYYSGGLYFYRRFIKPRLIRNNLIILRYHRIINSRKNDAVNISVTKESFEKQIQYIKSHFKVLGISEIVDSLKRQERFRSPALGITFDDGYKNNYTCGYPILKSLGIPAMIFLTVDYMDKDKTFPWDEQMPDKDDTAMLSWQEIAEMSKDGVSFGSHTLTHPKLDEISEEEARREISGSARILTEKLGRRIDIFSYPHGHFNSRVKELVKEAGYKAAFITKDGPFSENADLFSLPRKAIHESLVTNPFGNFSKSMFAVEIEGIFDLLLPGRKRSND